MRLELDLCTAGRDLRRDRLGLDKELRHASRPLTDKPSAKVVSALLTGRGGELKTVRVDVVSAVIRLPTSVDLERLPRGVEIDVRNLSGVGEVTAQIKLQAVGLHTSRSFAEGLGLVEEGGNATVLL